MRNLKLLALSATLLVATAGLAIAGGECNKSTETAQAKAGCSKTATAETAAVKTAGSEGGCSSTATAAVQTAEAKGACSSSTATAAVQTAGAEGGCSSTAGAVKTASAEGGCSSTASAVKTAGAEGHCNSASTAMAKGGCDSNAKAIKVETVRMPSGAMAVFYTGKNAEAVSFLHASAEKGCTGFACNVAKEMSSDAECKVEMAMTENGVMMLVTSEKSEVVNKYAEQYAAVTATSETQGDE